MKRNPKNKLRALPGQPSPLVPGKAKQAVHISGIDYDLYNQLLDYCHENRTTQRAVFEEALRAFLKKKKK